MLFHIIEMGELGTVLMVGLEHLVKRTPIDTFTASPNNDENNSISTKRKHSGKFSLKDFSFATR